MAEKTSTLARPRLPSRAALEARFGPMSRWEGRCYEIACAFVDAGLVPDGIAVYGDWLGPIAPRSRFASRGGLGFVQHGWIVRGPWIVDPTRWAFETVAPYVFVGRTDAHPEYDEGGNKRRRALRGRPPRFDAAKPLAPAFDAALPAEAREHVQTLFETPDPLTSEQLFWLANAPIDMLEPHARPIYEWMTRVHAEALIPLDNYRRGLGIRHGER